MIFRRTKRRSVVTENPKRGIAENFGRKDSEGGPLICLVNEDMRAGGRGVARVMKSYQGGSLQ